MVLNGHQVRIHDIHPDLVLAGQPVHDHEHSFYEGHLFLEGGGRYLTGRDEEIGVGGALLHSPHMAHAWAAYHQSCLRLLIWFTLEPMAPIIIPARWPVVPELYFDVMALLAEIRDHFPGWQHRLPLRMTTIISRFLAIGAWPAISDSDAMRSPHVDMVQMIEQFFRDNLARELSLNDVTTHVGMSSRTLSRNFAQITGETVMERLQTLRLQQAATLLAETEDSLTIIGNAVGIPEPSYFCRRFKKHFNMTPAQYRRRARGRESG